MKLEDVQNAAYALNVMLGELENEATRSKGIVEVSSAEIGEMAGYAAEILKFLDE